jgi:hypothetical protein
MKRAFLLRSHVAEDLIKRLKRAAKNMRADADYMDGSDAKLLRHKAMGLTYAMWIIRQWAK